MKRTRLIATLGAVGLAFSFGAGVAGAATIELLPPTINDSVGSTFTLDVVGRNFDIGSGGSNGGGLTIDWDPAVIGLFGGLSGLNITFAGDQFFASPPTLDVGAGSLDFSVSSLNGVAATNFDIAVLTFEALNPGTTTTGITISAIDVWPDFAGTTDVVPTGVGANVTVNPVPLPPAVFLFGSALAGLGFVGRRRKSQAQAAAA